LKQFFILTLTVTVFLLSGCSTKEVYEPKTVVGDWQKSADLSESIIDTAWDVALLENRHVLTKDGEINVTVAKNQRVISLSDGKVISATIDGNVSVVDIKSKEKESYNLKKTVAAASIKDNILAVVFANNDIALFDTDTKELIFKEQGGKAIAQDRRIVNPYFFNDLVMFPTLDGKVIIVNLAAKKRLRTSIVSSEEYFNNIIYFNIASNKILTATSYKLLSLSQKELRSRYEIRNILTDENTIYLTTKQGELIALTPELQVESKIKFPFAHFLGMILDGDKLYLLEKEGYLIVVDKNDFSYSVYEVDIDDEAFVFVGKDLFYIDDKEIKLH
jgi:outer membrane protein assembly factor BamB